MSTALSLWAALVLAAAAVLVAQLEDDYFTAHHHGGSMAVRLGLVSIAFALIGGVWVVGFLAGRRS